MRGIVLSVGVLLAACGSSSNGDSPGSGGTGGVAGRSGAAGASAGRAGAQADAGAAGASEAGEGGAAQGGSSAEGGEAGIGGEGGLAEGGAAGAAGAAGAEEGGAAGAGATCPRTLLVGGTDVAAQGWTPIAQGPNTISYGAVYVRLQTSTASGAFSGGQLLLSYPDALEPDAPFKLSVELMVESVNVHNQLDSGAAILASLTGSVGSQTDRSQMIYLDPTAVGWADNTGSAPFAVTDGSYHTYELSVDAAKEATLRVDGTVKLTRSNFTTNGRIAIGDQTNDANFDGTTRIRSVKLLCP